MLGRHVGPYEVLLLDTALQDAHGVLAHLATVVRFLGVRSEVQVQLQSLTDYRNEFFQLSNRHESPAAPLQAAGHTNKSIPSA